MTTLYLIRHGETTWNADGRFQGHQNTPLSATGSAQAQATAIALAQHHFTAIYSSDLVRAAQTALIIAAPHRQPVQSDPRLREAFFGAWEGLTLPEITARWPELVAAWRQDSLHTRPPGGETLEQVQARVAEMLTELITRHADEQVAIIGHGGSLRAMITLALGADLSLFRRLRLDNCSISILSARNEELSLSQMNDTCHLGQLIPRASWDEAGDEWRLALGDDETPGHGGTETQKD